MGVTDRKWLITHLYNIKQLMIAKVLLHYLNLYHLLYYCQLIVR